MRILLFNDNPVVRKLVTLSAQKTKDMLDVVWSVDEIEHSEYDLLIMDDALYSDDIFESIKEHVIYSKALLMATRGNAVPAGFDSVINKPFLPTDLVEILIQMNKMVASPSRAAATEEIPSDMPLQSADYEINLEDTMPKAAVSDDEGDELALLHSDEEEIDLDSFDETFLDDLDGDLPQILDQEEVLEVQNLLDDDEEQMMPAEAEERSDDISFDTEPEEADSADAAEEMEELSFDDFEDELEEHQTSAEEDEADLGVSPEPFIPVDDVQESLSALEMKIQQAMKGVTPEALDMDLDDAAWDEEVMDGALDGLELMEEDMVEADLAELSDADNSLDTDDFGLMDNADELEENSSEDSSLSDDTLEEDALEIPDFDFGNETEEEVEFVLPELENDGETDGSGEAGDAELDEFFGLDERDIKLAFGEEIADEELFAEHEAVEPDSDEADFADMIVPEETMRTAPADEVKVSVPAQAEGIEALQALLKVLSNEEVAKSLKALNISININFGNEQ